MSERGRERERARAQAADSDATVDTDVDAGTAEQRESDASRATQPADRSQRAGGEPQTRGNILAETLARDVQEQTGADVGRGDVRVARDDGRVSATLSQSAQERVATQQAARELSDAVPGRVEPADVQLGAGGTPQLAEDARKRALAQAGAADLDERLDIDVKREDVAVLDRGEGAATVLRPERQRDVTQRRVAEETGLSPRTDFRVDAPAAPNAQAEVELTASGRAELLRERLQEQEQITVDDTTIPADPEDVVVRDGQVRLRQDGGGGGGIIDTAVGAVGSAPDVLADLNRGVKGGEAFNRFVDSSVGGAADAVDRVTQPVLSGAGEVLDRTGDALGAAPGSDTLTDLTATAAGGTMSTSRNLEQATQERVIEPVAAGLSAVSPDPDSFSPGERPGGGGISDERQREILSAGGSSISGAVGLPADAVEISESTASATESAGERLADKGLATGSATVASGAAAAGVGAARSFESAARRNPAQVGAQLTTGLLTGTAAARGIETGARTLRARAAADRGAPSATFRELTSARAADTDELPQFETPTTAPASAARAEFETRARDQPSRIQEELGSDEVVFRSDTERFDREFAAEATEGRGLFVSPDLSQLRFDRSSATSAPGSLRLPNPFARPERASAFQTGDVRAVPDDVDEQTFLQMQAERGDVFTRQTGERTSELEGLFPPDTQFRRRSTGRLDVGGTSGTLDFFELADEQPRPGAAGVLDESPTARTRASSDADADVDDDLFTLEEIAERERRGGSDGDPITPQPATTGTRGSASDTGLAAPATSSFGDAFGSDTTASSSRVGDTSTGVFSSELFGGSSGSGAFSDAGRGATSSGASSGSAFGGGSSTSSGTGGSGGTLTAPPVASSLSSGGPTSSPSRTRLPSFDDDDERGDRLLEEEGAEQGFVNPVKTASEVLSAGSNPRGGDSELGLNGIDIDDMEGRL